MLPFEGMQAIEFLQEEPANYIVGFVRDEAFVPFYVGETGNLTFPRADYVRKAFAASAEYRVGMAIHLSDTEHMSFRLDTASAARSP